jgi:hypothetical protein
MLPDEELVDDGTDADFDSGFTSTTTEKPPAAPVEPKEAAKPTGELTEPVAGATPTPAAPEYVQLTKTELEELKAAASKTAGYDQQLARINGTLGNIKQNIAKPPVAETTVTPPLDADAIAKQKYTEAIMEHEMNVLTTEYPNWREIVGAPEQGGVENVNLQHPFRVWLGAQPVEYQAKINNANSSVIIMRAIEKFNDDTAKAAATKARATTPTPQVAARKAVIKDAIQPRGDGGAPPPAKTEDDHFAEGFRTG